MSNNSPMKNVNAGLIPSADCGLPIADCQSSRSSPHPILYYSSPPIRSEERRVGKEHRFWMCPAHSSRRRHTRSYGDWSSDVCSSDLESFSEPVISGKIPAEEDEQQQPDEKCECRTHPKCRLRIADCGLSVFSIIATSDTLLLQPSN